MIFSDSDGRMIAADASRLAEFFGFSTNVK
jgi:hypothetical protein